MIDEAQPSQQVPSAQSWSHPFTASPSQQATVERASVLTVAAPATETRGSCSWEPSAMKDRRSGDCAGQMSRVGVWAFEYTFVVYSTSSLSPARFYSNASLCTHTWQSSPYHRKPTCPTYPLIALCLLDLHISGTPAGSVSHHPQSLDPCRHV